MIEKTTDLAKEILKRKKGIKIAVDMTAGNGHDSKFILDELKPQSLYAFDIQQQAKDKTLKLLGPRENLTFILDSHANIDSYIEEEIDLVVYNLGYLPKGNKEITTKVKSTLASLEKSLALLSKSGTVLITVYPGHPAGEVEAKGLGESLAKLEQNKFTVMKISYENKVNKPPFIYIIEKK